jgi:hypothetical protein
MQLVTGPAGETGPDAYENRRTACVMYNCSFWSEEFV